MKNLLKTFYASRLARQRTWFYVAVFVFCNLGIFIYANTRPISWQQPEVTFRGFYWSINGIPDDYRGAIVSQTSGVPVPQAGNKEAYRMHLGVRKIDFLKLFALRASEGAVFRLRQFSDLIDMLSYKFWQCLGIVTFRNYTLILIHIINTLLLYQALKRVTRHWLSASAGALLFFNSGVAISTLLFPFRTSKPLICTLFLMAWNMSLGLKEGNDRGAFFKKILFFLIIICAFFTDESFLFLFPFFIFDHMTRRKFKSNEFHYAVAGASTVILGVSLAFYFLCERADDSINLSSLMQQLHTLGNVWGNTAVVTDTLKAFFCYFVRRNFGYWDFSILGIIIFFLVLLSAYVVLKSRHSSTIKRIIFIFFTLIFLKAFLLPHISGVHPFFMPTETRFPSLLFFNYYYTYSDSLLICAAVGLLLAGVSATRSNSLIVFLIVTIISVSNGGHWNEGVRDALDFHACTHKDRQEVAMGILKIKKVLGVKNLQPIYLSFLSGDEETFQTRHDSAYAIAWFYSCGILGNYLGPLERGQLITSLKNVGPPNAEGAVCELFQAKTFFDVTSQEMVDIDAMWREKNISNLWPKKIKNVIETAHFLIKAGERQRIIFFIKGRAHIVLKVGETAIQGDQAYGGSYQVFQSSFDGHQLGKTMEASLTIYPNRGAKGVFLVGPIVLKDGL